MILFPTGVHKDETEQTAEFCLVLSQIRDSDNSESIHSSRVYTIREYFYRIRREHQRNGFLAGDLGAGRYALAYPFLELATANHSVVIPHTFTCVLYNVHKKAKISIHIVAKQLV